MEIKGISPVLPGGADKRGTTPPDDCKLCCEAVIALGTDIPALSGNGGINDTPSGKEEETLMDIPVQICRCKRVVCILADTRNHIRRHAERILFSAARVLKCRGLIRGGDCRVPSFRSGPFNESVFEILYKELRGEFREEGIHGIL